MKDALEKLLHNEIPLTRAIGIRVAEASPISLTLTAPLANNINHKSTAFGGSLYSVAVLSGWGLIHTLMQRHGLNGHIVIQESQTKFIRPVVGEIRACCSFESDHHWQRFIDMYRRKSLARIALESQIVGEAGPALRFEGRYVVHA